jgi:hypothetical protein
MISETGAEAGSWKVGDGPIAQKQSYDLEINKIYLRYSFSKIIFYQIVQQTSACPS